MTGKERELKAGEDSRKNWQEINRAHRYIKELERRLVILEAENRRTQFAHFVDLEVCGPDGPTIYRVYAFLKPPA